MEDKSMKLTKLTILFSSFLLLASLIIAEDKSIGKDKFLLINPIFGYSPKDFGEHYYYFGV